MKTKKGEKEKLRLLILDKAVAYLKKHGEVGSGTDQIMNYVGLTRGALYSHFKSKEDLFAQAVCFDLKNLENSLRLRFQNDGKDALKKIITDHLSEKSLTDVEDSCVFTSLSTDMQRSKPSHRAMYEAYMHRIYSMFAEALQKQFPKASAEENYAKAINLYSSLVGTLTMARTMKDPKQAKKILETGKEFLIQTFSQASK